MSVTSTLDPGDLSVRHAEAVVAGGLFGAFQGGLLLTLWDARAITLVGRMVGVTSIMASWFVLFGVGVLLGVPFVAVVAGSVDAFASKVMLLSRRSDVLRRLLVPALQFSAYGVTLMGVGTIYGVVLAIAFYGLAVPLWVSALGYSAPVPFVNPITVFGWLTYGSMLGLVYGLVMEQ